MTLQEAIETVENGAFWDECIFPDDRSAVNQFHKALDIMIAELQARQSTLNGTYVSVEWFNEVKAELDALKAEKSRVLDRHGRGGCEVCLSIGAPENWEDGINFCPHCGKPITEEALAELERRINGGTID